MVPRATLSPYEQQMKCTNFLQSLEPMPINLMDFSGAGMINAEALSMANPPMMPGDSIEIMAGNDLGLINGPFADGKLQDPFMNVSGLEMPDPNLLASAGAVDMSNMGSMMLTSPMPSEIYASAVTTPVAPEWVA